MTGKLVNSNGEEWVRQKTHQGDRINKKRTSVNRCSLVGYKDCFPPTEREVATISKNVISKLSKCIYILVPR